LNFLETLMYTFVRFPLDDQVVAPCIYRSSPHRTTGVGLRLSRELRHELSTFMFSFLVDTDAPSDGTYFRMDAFLRPDGGLSVIEINAAFVDGWGTAMNLARASGNPVYLADASFPKYWSGAEQQYWPELELACSELRVAGRAATVITAAEARRLKEPVYWYGAFQDQFYWRPIDGIRLDDKQLLALLGQSWSGSLVHIPRHYFVDQTPWDSLSREIILKFRSKHDPEVAVELARKRLPSVARREQIGRGKYWRRQYSSRIALAQDLVEPLSCPLMVDDVADPVTQVIIFFVGQNPVTGYLQVVERGRRVINDDSVHGPVVFVD